jgi:uncharacterized protein DUF6924
MPGIGPTEQAVVLRTDFSDEETWRAVCTEMLAETAEGFRAYVDFVENPSFDGLDTNAILSAAGDEYRWGFLIVADQVTMAEPEHPLLVLDLFHEPGRSFRAPPREIQSIENNLSISNMDFHEFADSVDADGVFRGFDP